MTPRGAAPPEPLYGGHALPQSRFRVRHLKGTPVRASRLTAVAAAIALAASLAACSTTSDDATPSQPTTTITQPAATTPEPAFPVTFKHTYGNTTIEKQPERIVAVGPANHEVPLALGIVPVAMIKATWGDNDENGILPWVEEKLKELNAETPVLFDETDGIDIDAVAKTKPDVILAAYSGLTQEEYDGLSKIAPVVSYPGDPRGTSYEDMIALNAKAIGKTTEGHKLIDALREKTAASLADHPDIAEKKILFATFDPADLSTITFATTVDTRAGFLVGQGLPMPSVMPAIAKENTELTASLGSAEFDKLADVDIFVTYGDLDGSIVKTLQADPQLSKVPAIAAGHIAVLPDSTPIAVSLSPSPLSIPWGLNEYYDILADALK